MKKILLAAALLFCAQVNAGIITLSFTGQVDGSGFSIGGVGAAGGSNFTLNVDIDDSLAGTGRYAVNSISFFLDVGSYTTVGSWAVDLVAAQTVDGISLMTDPLFANPDEHFLMNLSGVGPGLFSDPGTWADLSPFSGDFIVRGVGGFNSLDQFSGGSPFTGTVQLQVLSREVSEPSMLGILGLGLLLLGFTRNRK